VCVGTGAPRRAVACSVDDHDDVDVGSDDHDLDDHDLDDHHDDGTASDDRSRSRS
jgi:hypothetical protein